MAEHYPDKSKELKDFAEKFRAECQEKAQKIISEKLSAAAEKLAFAMTDGDCDPDAIALKKLQKDSATQILKFGGLSESQKVDLSGSVNFIPVKFEHETDGKASSDKAEPRSLKTE